MTAPIEPPINSTSPAYIGRFAPSPTGALHFGSLIAALASYLDARHQGGRWLLRIEDLDPPREEPGATEAIIKCLQAHHLNWDGDILYQSQRLEAYTETLESLHKQGLIYRCYCTRKDLSEVDGPYPGTCRKLLPKDDPAALRLLCSDLPPSFQHLNPNAVFEDIFLGKIKDTPNLGDFIVRRKDGLFAYQLAVVVDDAYQGITHIIRGADLIDCTPSQQYLFQLLHQSTPQFGHLPMALNEHGQKLSKQHGASPLDNSNSQNNLLAALKFLNHAPPKEMEKANEEALLHWAIKYWDRKKIYSAKR